MSKIDTSLFTHADTQNFGKCPSCNAELTIKHAKSGAFIGCTAYPTCDYTQAFHDTEVEVVKQIEGSECPLCAHELVIKKGRYGLFVGCSDFPTCQYMQSVKEKQETRLSCPKCSAGELVKRVNRFGKAFYACSNYPKCKFAINYPPVEQTCEACGSPILVKRQSVKGEYLQCPEKQCQHKHL